MAYVDWIIDFGFGVGYDGGCVVFEGMLSELVVSWLMLIGQYLVVYVAG